MAVFIYFSDVITTEGEEYIYDGASQLTDLPLTVQVKLRGNVILEVIPNDSTE